MSIEALEGRTYGDLSYRICREKVAEFVRSTGDDSDRWDDEAPPGMAAALLFVVAPELLDDPLVEGAVVHGDQQFRWLGPLRPETELAVRGTVEKVRSRGTASFVIFGLSADSDEGPVVEGRSTFVVGPGAVAESPVDPIPVYQRGTVSSRRRSASRADLVRYAAATRDWNPIHWDHVAASEAGLGGVVVHGLLQSSWLTQVAAESGRLESARFRYTSMLRPGEAADIEGERAGDEFELRLVAGDEVTVSGRFRVAS